MDTYLSIDMMLALVAMGLLIAAKSAWEDRRAKRAPAATRTAADRRVRTTGEIG